MFRPMRRFKQQISEEECIRILSSEKRGVLSMMGEDGYPYGIPLNHWYNPEDGKLYFHGAKTGHKLDALRKDNRVSYCVWDAGYRKDGEWALNINSVIVFGRIEMLQDHEKALDICRRLRCGFTDDTTYIDNEIARFGAGVCVFVLTPEHITGKQVNEA